MKVEPLDPVVQAMFNFIVDQKKQSLTILAFFSSVFHRCQYIQRSCFCLPSSRLDIQATRSGRHCSPSLTNQKPNRPSKSCVPTLVSFKTSDLPGQFMRGM